MKGFKKYQTPDTAALEAHEASLTPVDRFNRDMANLRSDATSIVSVEGWFSDHGARLTISIKEAFRSLTTYNFPVFEPLNPSQMKTIVQGIKYTAVDDQMMPQPAGLCARYKEYLELLEKLTPIATNLIADIIEPSIKRFGHYLSVPDERGDTRDFMYGVDTTVDAEAIFRSNMSKVMVQGNHEAASQFGNLFDSMNDFVACETLMVKLVDSYSTASPDRVQHAVGRMQLTATALIQRLERDDSGASREFVAMVAEELERVARYLQLYSLITTKVIEANNVLASIEQKLRDL
jgi:hypothetical protein